MGNYVIRRLPSALITLVIASMAIFLLLRLVPGDPAAALAGPSATPETVAGIRAQLGLDDSIVGQYLHWIGNLLTLDFGHSYVVGGEIKSLIGDGLVNTLVLAGTSLLIALALTIGLSTIAVAANRPWLTGVVTAFGTMGIAVPTFVTGSLLVLVFAILIPVLPAGGAPPEGFFVSPEIAIQYLILPAACLGLPVAAALTRFLFESLHTQMRQPYVTTARALGISRRRIVSQTLRNALPPTVTALGIQVGALLGGAVLVETIFAWPGLGLLLQKAITAQDYPLAQVLLLFAVVVFVLTQLLTDLVNAYLDPRIRLRGAA
jgi:peptide/nickel transport system permease protein